MGTITIHDSELHAPQYDTMHQQDLRLLRAFRYKGGFAAVPSSFPIIVHRAKARHGFVSITGDVRRPTPSVDLLKVDGLFLGPPPPPLFFLLKRLRAHTNVEWCNETHLLEWREALKIGFGSRVSSLLFVGLISCRTE
jgi:hypothetical protein